MEILINGTVMTTVVALLILLTKRIFKEKMTPRWQLLIWIVLLVEILAFPIKDAMPQSAFSLENYVPTLSDVTVVADIKDEDSQESELGDGSKPNYSYIGEIKMKNPVYGSDITMEIAINKFLAGDYGDLLIKCWISGAIALFAFFILIHFAYRRRLTNLPFCDREEIIKILEDGKSRMGILREINIKVGTSSPMLVGIYRPTIYISNDYTDEELRHVITHELCHYKHQDILINVLATFILCIFWYNPIMWLCFYAVRKDIEVYCDDRAIGVLGNRKEYSAVLLKTAVGKNNFLLASTSFLNGEKEVTKRIKHIANFKKPRRWVAAGIIIIICILGIVSLTNGGSGTLGRQAKTESLIYPTGGETDYTIFSVPPEWVTKGDIVYVGIDGKESNKYSQTAEELIFESKKGYAFGGIKKVPISDESRGNMMSANSGLSTNMVSMADIEFKEIIKAFLYNEPMVQGGEISIKEVKQDNKGKETSRALNFHKVYIASSDIGDKTYSYAFGIGSRIYCIWADSDYASSTMLINILETIREYDDPENSVAYGRADFEGAKTKEEWVTAAKGLLEDWLNNCEKLDLPIEKAIKGYKINSLTPVIQRGTISKVKDSTFSYRDETLWNLIYPSARVYKVDYEVTPYMKERYADWQGGGFEKTKSGNKHYGERYAVFLQNTYVKSENLADLYFVGFVSDEQINEYGIDAAVLEILDRWYENNILSYAQVLNHTKYIGDVAKVGALVSSLPLYERVDVSEGTFTDKGIIVKTWAEPYGITVNYWFDNPLYNYDLANLEGKDVAKTIKTEEVNKYIKEQVYKNMDYLISGIDNVGEVTINIWCDRGEAEYTCFTYKKERGNDERVATYSIPEY